MQDSGIGSSMGVSSWGAPLMQSDGGGGGSKKPKAGCFIATAAYGTPLAPEINVLRRWRDGTLSCSAAGRAFIRAYYRLSPPVARLIEPSAPLRAGMRLLLRPFIWLLKQTCRGVCSDGDSP